MPKFQSLKGFRDFYPEDFAKRAHVVETWRRVAKSYGFLEYDAPPLESLDLYRQKSGEELVGQLYSFTDKGGREVALRPEMTPSVVRMVAERWQALPKPVRWFSVPQLFRYERPQAGRLREHFQFNVDVFGDSSVIAEADVLAVVIDAFRSFGLTPSDVQIHVSDRRLLNRILSSIGIAEASFPLVYGVLDKFDRQSRSVSAEKLVSGGLSGELIERLFERVEKFRTVKSSELLHELLGESDPFIAMMYHLSESVDNAREWVTFDLAIVRGLGYYTGTVFEAFDTQRKFRAICGGGRYDTLLENLGGPSAPAVGMGWGDVVLTELLDDRKLLPSNLPATDLLIFSAHGSISDSRMFAKEIRSLGLSAETVHAGKSHSASGKHAKFVVGIMSDWVTLTESASGLSVRLPYPNLLLSELRTVMIEHGRPPTGSDIVQLMNRKDLHWKSPAGI
jgi:histidyl-tRNA synthetase